MNIDTPHLSWLLSGSFSERNKSKDGMGSWRLLSQVLKGIQSTRQKAKSKVLYDSIHLTSIGWLMPPGFNTRHFKSSVTNTQNYRKHSETINFLQLKTCSFSFLQPKFRGRVCFSTVSISNSTHWFLDMSVPATALSWEEEPQYHDHTISTIMAVIEISKQQDFQFVATTVYYGLLSFNHVHVIIWPWMSFR